MDTKYSSVEKRPQFNRFVPAGKRVFSNGGSTPRYNNNNNNNNNHNSNNNGLNGNHNKNKKQKFNNFNAENINNHNNNNGNNKSRQFSQYYNNHNGYGNGNGNNGTNGHFNNKSDNRKISDKKLITLNEQRETLPAFIMKDQILAELRDLETCIIIGETGSGKTTQIPQFLHEEGYTNRGMIAITQPRRVAAITISKRVAQEQNCRLGDIVGYTVRFEDCTSNKTKIKYMTDGLLVREALADRLLLKYRVIILDEAHERTTDTDVLFGIIKQAQQFRAESSQNLLKIIIMSATMDVDHFSEYFNNCKVLYLEGREHEVKIMQSKTSQPDYLQACLSTFLDIHTTAPANHDILIFLTGQEEIEYIMRQARSILNTSHLDAPTARIFPLYSQLAQNRQIDVFLPTAIGTRKVILSTNIAETSLTISGIKFVIDSGVVKRRIYDSVTGMDKLTVVRISKEQAQQRSGRAGRDSDGVCYRTYTTDEFDSMAITSVPEILRSNITSTVLQLCAIGIDSRTFDFIDAPTPESIDLAIKQLQKLGAMHYDKCELTGLGKRMAKFPLDPKYSKILLSAPEFCCLDEMLSLIAVLSGETIFHHTIDGSKQAEERLAHSKFQSEYGDHLTLLNVYQSYQNTDRARMWCHDNFLNVRNLAYATEVRKQLSEICERLGVPRSSCGNDYDRVRKCLITGLYNNLAELQRDNSYLTLSGRQKTKIHPTSCMVGKPHAEFVLFTELVQTSQNYMRTLSVIERDWIEMIVPNSNFMNRINNRR